MPVQQASWQSTWPSLEYESGKSFWRRKYLNRGFKTVGICQRDKRRQARQEAVWQGRGDYRGQSLGSAQSLSPWEGISCPVSSQFCCPCHPTTMSHHFSDKHCYSCGDFQKHCHNGFDSSLGSAIYTLWLVTSPLRDRVTLCRKL